MGTFWEDLGKKFGETAETVTNKAGEVVEVQKLKNQIRALERGNESDFVDLGRMVYAQFKNGVDMSVEASGLCEAIQSREESIGEYEKQIIDVRGEFSCSSCGKTVAKGMFYCPYCGEKTPEDLKEKAKEYTTELKEKAVDAAETLAEKAAETAEKVGEAAGKAGDKAGEWAEKAGDLADKAAEKVEEATEKAVDKLKEKTEENDN